MKVTFQNQIPSSYKGSGNKNSLSKEKQAEFKSYGYELSGNSLKKALICGAASTVPIGLVASLAFKKPAKTAAGIAAGTAAIISSALYPLFDLGNIKKRKAKLEELQNNSSKQNKV